MQPPAKPGGRQTVSKRVRELANQRVAATQHPLTYKSSLDNACKATGLDNFTIDLPIKQKSWRAIYASQKFLDWVNLVVPHMTFEDQDADSGCTQAEVIMFDFCYGRPLRLHVDIRHLEEHDSGVWELKTPDLRLFGWFLGKDYFIAHTGEKKDALPNRAAYEPFIQDVIQFRSDLEASGLPGHLTGGYLDVISNRA